MKIADAATSGLCLKVINLSSPAVKKKTALMIVPTYNEAKNIEHLLDILFNLKEVKRAGWQLDVLVMDDTSPDGTGEIVENLMNTKYQGRLYLERGQKQGLGRALQRSFDAALRLNHEVVLTMDADFSHDPNDIPNLLKGIDDGADVAIGSRYIDGGLIPGNWPLQLIIRTRIATAVARWLGGVSRDIRELTTNFRAVRRHVLDKIDYNKARASGYGFQIFLANAFTSHDFKVAEVPITFRNRANGVSKARIKDVLEFFRIAYNLNIDSPAKQIVRFLTVGASGTIINLGSLWLMGQIFGWQGLLFSFIAIQISIVWNFFWHSMFTFRKYTHAVGLLKNGRLFLGNLVRYEGAVIFTQLIILSVFWLLSGMGMYYVLAQFFGICTAFVVNYYLSSTFIWSLRRAHVR